VDEDNDDGYKGATMATIFGLIIGFFVQAFALKLALGAMGQPAAENRYSRALGVSAMLTVAGFILGFVPFFGWLLSSAVWVAVVMSVYHIGFLKSVGVAILQVVLRFILGLLLALFGIKVGAAGLFF
jgi:hypothetical protein